MRIVGVNLTDGKTTLVTRYSDGLHLSIIGLDPRGDESLGASLEVTVGELATLVVSPTPVRLATGGTTLEFEAFGYDADGNPVAVTPVWSIVEGGTDASIDSETGVLTTGDLTEEEVVTVRAAVGSITADAEATIEDITIDDLDVFPTSWNMTVGQTKQFTATGYAAGVVVAVAPVWSKVSGVGTIDASTGLYTAGTTAGSAVIRATVGAQTADATITVAAGEMTTLTISPHFPTIDGGATEDFTVVGSDAYGNIVAFDGSPISWSCTNGGTIESGAPTVTFTAQSSETVQILTDVIQVTYKLLSDTASITLNPGTGEGEPE